MTDKFSPSGDAAPIPALPNQVEQKWREFLSVGGFFNPGPTASANEDALRTLIFETIDELSRLRLLVPSSQSETPTESLQSIQRRTGVGVAEAMRVQATTPTTCKTCRGSGFIAYWDGSAYAGEGCPDCVGGPEPAALPVVQDEAPKDERREFAIAIVDAAKRLGITTGKASLTGLEVLLLLQEIEYAAAASLGASRPSPADRKEGKS